MSDNIQDPIVCKERSLANLCLGSGLHVLIIATNTCYDPSVARLRCAEHDGTSIRNAFSQYPWNVPPHQITLLIGKEATCSNIRVWFQQIKSQEKIGPQDAVIIYFAGHSRLFQLDVLGQQAYMSALCMYPTSRTKVNEDENGANQKDILYSIEVNFLIKSLHHRTRNITVILDTCHASCGTQGPISPLETGLQFLRIPLAKRLRCMTSRQIARVPEIDIDDVLRPINHRYQSNLSPMELEVDTTHTLLASCHWNEGSWEGSRNGIFTAALITVLKSPTVRTISTATALAHAIRSEMDQPHPRQNPQCGGENSASPLFGGYRLIPVPFDGDGSDAKGKALCC